ncbi:YbaB/EbfC DNA-binding family protein [Stackebrandtia albiflava]|uniref:YbaB/EbfC DNA-binding family protein n=1 Tax=Stackebrandtia albiflava TaxID=406432 RepID=A0A562UPI3_9ACTN|nr:YbaB/EbfC family nucleoid-associated protein [Stackebrandtia albiflava]TWJ07506.1 YbaB/EbfC DNA-binding family protein [Stackebrandtia albiflava]
MNGHETESPAGVSELDRAMQREAVHADALQRRLESVRSTAVSSDGTVTAEVDCAGALCRLDLTPESVGLGAVLLADTIRLTTAHARARLPERLREAADAG